MAEFFFVMMGFSVGSFVGFLIGVIGLSFARKQRDDAWKERDEAWTCRDRVQLKYEALQRYIRGANLHMDQ